MTVENLKVHLNVKQVLEEVCDSQGRAGTRNTAYIMKCRRRRR
jgi:hypothetical protein